MSNELFLGDLDTPPLRPQGQTAWDELEYFRRRYFERAEQVAGEADVATVENVESPSA